MRKTEKEDLKILEKIKLKAIKGGSKDEKAGGVACPPPEPDSD